MDGFQEEVRDVNFNGEGIYVFPDGKKYIGKFKNGRFHGSGTLLSSSGDMYIGEFKNHKCHGSGKLTLSNGIRYEGEFKNNKYHGSGTLIFPDGDMYVGEFKNGRYHGMGEYSFPHDSNGSVKHTGKFKNDKFIEYGDYNNPTTEQDKKRRETYGFWKTKILDIKPSNPIYLFFDTETTGNNEEGKAHLVQLAYILYDSKGKIIQQEDYIIKPNGFTIPTESTEIHGITNDRAMQEGIELSCALMEFHKAIEKANYLIAHNIKFDLNIIKDECTNNTTISMIMDRSKQKNVFQALSPKLDSINQICTMESTTDYCKIIGANGYKWPKLAELHHKLFNSYFQDEHNALADVKATAKCFWELKRREFKFKIIKPDDYKY